MINFFFFSSPSRPPPALGGEANDSEEYEGTIAGSNFSTNVFDRSLEAIKKSLFERKVFAQERQEKLRHLLFYEFHRTGEIYKTTMSPKELLNDLLTEINQVKEATPPSRLLYIESNLMYDEKGKLITKEIEILQPLQMKDIRKLDPFLSSPSVSSDLSSDIDELTKEKAGEFHNDDIGKENNTNFVVNNDKNTSNSEDNPVSYDPDSSAIILRKHVVLFITVRNYFYLLSVS
jgi:hypothetical protein